MLFFFFFNDTATTEIYTLSLHDALPICGQRRPSASDPAPVHPPRSHVGRPRRVRAARETGISFDPSPRAPSRSEEHTSELQSRQYLVCRLLLEKKKT